MISGNCLQQNQGFPYMKHLHLELIQIWLKMNYYNDGVKLAYV